MWYINRQTFPGVWNHWRYRWLRDLLSQKKVQWLYDEVSNQNFRNMVYHLQFILDAVLANLMNFVVKILIGIKVTYAQSCYPVSLTNGASFLQM